MKTVIITGASGGLGTAVTQHFLDKGYRVAATVRSEGSKNDLPSHPHLHVTAVDLNDAAASAGFVTDTVAAHGAIHAALLLAGGFSGGKIAEATTADIQKQIAINFESAYHIAQPVFMHCLEKGHGRIVFIGGRPALQATVGKDLVAYGLSKSLLFKLAEFMNAEAKGKDVTATVIVPSTIDTAANREGMPDADPVDWVKPGTLAELLAFVCSDAGEALREPVLKAYGNA